MFIWNIYFGTFGSGKGDPVIKDQQKRRLKAVIKMFFVMGLTRIVEIISYILEQFYGRSNLTIHKLTLFFDIMIALQVSSISLIIKTRMTYRNFLLCLRSIFTEKTNPNAQILSEQFKIYGLAGFT